MELSDATLIRMAFKRAAGRTAAVRFVAVSDGGYATYAVGSSRDVDAGYRVTVSPAGEYRCTCPSELRPACWHRAAVASVRASRAAAGLEESGPAPAEARRERARLALEEIDKEFSR